MADDVTTHHTGRHVSTTGWCASEDIKVVVVLATENLLIKKCVNGESGVYNWI